MLQLICLFQFKKMYMLAVGTGIAPMSQVIETVLNNEDEDTIIQLLYGCRTYEDILMKKELQEWSRYWNFSCQYHLSQVSARIDEFHIPRNWPCHMISGNQPWGNAASSLMI